MECDGINLESLFIPPFELKMGEVLCCQMPGLAESPTEKLVIETFTGERMVHGLRCVGKVRHANSYQMSYETRWHRLAYYFHRPLIVTKLRRLARMSRTQAEEVARRHGVSLRSRIAGIEQDARMMLVLEVAWAQGADVVVFSAVGCPAEPLYAEIAKHLHHCAAIELCYPVFTQGRQERRAFPGGTCLEITQTSQPGARRELASR